MRLFARFEIGEQLEARVSAAKSLIVAAAAVAAAAAVRLDDN